jgi:hypothetical protein
MILDDEEDLVLIGWIVHIDRAAEVVVVEWAAAQCMCRTRSREQYKRQAARSQHSQLTCALQDNRDWAACIIHGSSIRPALTYRVPRLGHIGSAMDRIGPRLVTILAWSPSRRLALPSPSPWRIRRGGSQVRALERSRPCDSTECRKHPHPWPSHLVSPEARWSPQVRLGDGRPGDQVAMPRESL